MHVETVVGPDPARIGGDRSSLDEEQLAGLDGPLDVLGSTEQLLEPQSFDHEITEHRVDLAKRLLALLPANHIGLGRRLAGHERFGEPFDDLESELIDRTARIGGEEDPGVARVEHGHEYDRHGQVILGDVAKPAGNYGGPDARGSTTPAAPNLSECRGPRSDMSGTGPRMTP